MAISKESDLYIPLKSFFEEKGFVVRSEVNRCDLVARNEEGQFIIVEMKKSLNLTVLIQGVKRLSLTDQVYLAVEYTPRTRKRHAYTWKDATDVCKRIGIGLITVEFFKTRNPRVEVWCEPAASEAKRKTPTKKQQRLAKEFSGRSGDYHLGGITGQKLVTAYREKSLHCAYILKSGEPVRLKFIREQTGIDTAASILRNNYYGWFARESRGYYRITEQGKQALDEYAHIVEKMLSK